MAWQTAWEITLTGTKTDAGRRNYRNIIPADTSSYDGTKIRITVPAGAGGDFTFNGASIGLMTTADDFDSAPTRITWDSGNDGATVPADGSKVSDEIDFSFDKTKRYGIHLYMANRSHIKHVDSGGDGLYWKDDVDNTLTQTVSYTSQTTMTYGAQKLEVFVSPSGAAGALSLNTGYWGQTI